MQFFPLPFDNLYIAFLLMMIYYRNQLHSDTCSNYYIIAMLKILFYFTPYHYTETGIG